MSQEKVVYLVLSGGMAVSLALLTLSMVLSLAGVSEAVLLAHASVLTLLATPPLLLVSYAVYSAARRMALDALLALLILLVMAVSVLVGLSI